MESFLKTTKITWIVSILLLLLIVTFGSLYFFLGMPKSAGELKCNFKDSLTGYSVDFKWQKNDLNKFLCIKYNNSPPFIPITTK